MIEWKWNVGIEEWERDDQKGKSHWCSGGGGWVGVLARACTCDLAGGLLGGGEGVCVAMSTTLPSCFCSFLSSSYSLRSAILRVMRVNFWHNISLVDRAELDDGWERDYVTGCPTSQSGLGMSL